MKAKTTETRQVDRGETTATVAIVRIELPQAVVEEARGEDGEIDPDDVSDRVRVLPTVGGEPV